MDVLAIHARPDGFVLHFTRPLSGSNAALAIINKVEHYYYQFHQYGSLRMDETTVAVQSIAVADDNQPVRLILSDMVPGYVYDISLLQQSSEKRMVLKNNRIFYTLNQVPPEIFPLIYDPVLLFLVNNLAT